VLALVPLRCALQVAEDLASPSGGRERGRGKGEWQSGAGCKTGFVDWKMTGFFQFSWARTAGASVA